MPRVRLSEQGKNRRTSSGDILNSSTNEFGINDGLKDFSDYSYDEFEFDAQPSSSSNAVATPKTSAQSTVAKKKSTKTSKSSYPKLFNSSKDKNDENEESVPNTNRKNGGVDVPRVSFDPETKSIGKKKAAGGKKKDTNKRDTKAKRAKAKEPRSFPSDEDLYDTDSDEELLVQPITKSAKKRVSIDTDGEEQINAASKSTKKRTDKSTSDDFTSTDKELMKATTSAMKSAAKSTKSTKYKNIKEGTKEASRTRTKSSSQISTLRTILPHRALGIDNRALPNINGDSMTASFLSRMRDFIEGALDKGLLTRPSSGVAGGAADGQTVMVSLTHGGNCVGVKSSWLSDTLTPINCHFGSDAIGDEVSFDYGDESMDVDYAKKKDRKIKGFAASDSWGYFADMVEATCSKANSSQTKHPYTLSIFTTDANLFADTNPESQVAGFNQFWKRVTRKKKVSAITIVIVDTTSVVQAMESAREYCSYPIAGMSFDSEMPNRLDILQCVSLLRHRIQDVSDATMKIKLDFMDGSLVDFQTLLQMWMKESLVQTYQSVDGKLQFELPETIDGTMCSISLDLKYTMLPGRINSDSTIELIRDMQHLSSLSPTCVEVLQTVPLHSVDSSLIYGVPMYARSGLEHDDLCQCNQMKILVRQLWRYLSRNDVALLLRLRRDRHKENDKDDTFHTRNQSYGELYLLTAQVAVQKQIIHLDSSMQSSSVLDIIPDSHRKGESPCNGILYRYATKNQILHFGNEESGHGGEEENAEEVSEYADYIDRSMDLLTSSGLNPFLVNESHRFEASGLTRSQESTYHTC